MEALHIEAAQSCSSSVGVGPIYGQLGHCAQLHHTNSHVTCTLVVVEAEMHKKKRKVYAFRCRNGSLCTQKQPRAEMQDAQNLVLKVAMSQTLENSILEASKVFGQMFV